ncbi:hypothetical protein [Chachezhania sediminis]|uniref:hypothetical protein n=1 Tax=Chachezhania sediminis TaxID=2599291 RepID=UPI00131B98D9|nr:hypothetical protein [Chachezhania sediminis]
MRFMIAVRYFLVLLLPVLVAWGLWTLTWQIQVDLMQRSSGVIARFMSPDADIRAAAVPSLIEHNSSGARNMLGLAKAGAFLLVGATTAFLTPVSASATQVTNHVTAQIVGLAAAQFIIGFPSMFRWPEFWLWAAGSAALAVLVRWGRLALASSGKPA